MYPKPVEMSPWLCRLFNPTTLTVEEVLFDDSLAYMRGYAAETSLPVGVIQDPRGGYWYNNKHYETVDAMCMILHLFG